MLPGKFVTYPDDLVKVPEIGARYQLRFMPPA